VAPDRESAPNNTHDRRDPLLRPGMSQSTTLPDPSQDSRTILALPQGQRMLMRTCAMTTDTTKEEMGILEILKTPEWT